MGDGVCVFCVWRGVVLRCVGVKYGVWGIGVGECGGEWDEVGGRVRGRRRGRGRRGRRSGCDGG